MLAHSASVNLHALDVFLLQLTLLRVVCIMTIRWPGAPCCCLAELLGTAVAVSLGTAAARAAAEHGSVATSTR
jgi:hypothetical protein